MSGDFDTFLAYIGAIREAAVRGYGGQDVVVDIFLAPRLKPDEEVGLRIRLIGENRGKDRTWSTEREFSPRMIRAGAGDTALEVLTGQVEQMGRSLKASEAS